MIHFSEQEPLKKAVSLYIIVGLVISLSFIVPTPLSAILTYLSIIIITLLFAYYSKTSFHWGKGFKLGAILAAILISGIFALEKTLNLIHFNNLIPQAEAFLIGAALFEILISFGEELSFRGYILPNLITQFGNRRGVCISAAMFSLLHLPSMTQMQLPNLNVLIMITSVFVAGILLALCYIHFGLKMAIGFHLTWNFLQYHVYSLRSDFGIYEEMTAELPIWTGGTAGPEAGLIGLITLILGAALIQLLKNALSVKELNTLHDR